MTDTDPTSASAGAPVDSHDAPESLAEPQAEPQAETTPFAQAPEPLQRALAARGFDAPTAVQAGVLDALERTADLRISSQTGSGKTVALGLAMAHDVLEDLGHGPRREYRGPAALVVVPTRELAAQVAEELGWLFGEVRGVYVDVVTGGTPVGPERRRLARDPRILVGTPGRLVDHLESQALGLENVRQLVLDEADQMLDMGFRDELEAILGRTPNTRRTHLVSATFPDAILHLANRYQETPHVVEGTRLGEANEDIEHVGILLRPHQRYDALVNLLLEAGDERVLVFVNTRAETGDLAARLASDGFTAQPLSGELHQAQRTRTLAAFRAGTANVLVATDVAARGLDVPDVALVIHTAAPIDAEAYTHRSGRTGRAGTRGRSILMTAPSRERRVARLLSEAGVTIDWRPVPRARDVQAVLDERARQTLESALEEAAAAEPSDRDRELARALLEGRDPELVVATLAARARVEPPAAPRDIEGALKPRANGRRREGERDRGRHGRFAERSGFRRRDMYDGPGDTQPHGAPEHDGPTMDRAGFLRGDDRGAPRPGADRQDLARHEQMAPRGGRHDLAGHAVRFSINWGFRGGANPRRLLAVLCRRGQVTGRDVGKIHIGPSHATFEVAAPVAETFANNAMRDDPRDPGLYVSHDRRR